MEYQLNINEDKRVLTVTPEGDRRFDATIGETTYTTSFEWISEHAVLLNVNGEQTTAYLADGPDGKTVMIKGRVWSVEDQGSSTRRKNRGNQQKLPKDIRPPMPAVVSQILVSKGDLVTEGQGVIVVSAMKMETTLLAPFNGIVTEINIAEGDKVTPKQILVDISETQTDDMK